MFCSDMIFFVILSLCAGYMDNQSRFFSQTAKFSLALLSIIPLAYYIGMGISSISAQSSYAIGAVLNATFGSIVEIILYLSALYKGKKEGTSQCYEGLVKSALVGLYIIAVLECHGYCLLS
ncbi:hypothetical protein LSH36_7g02024 [Paralvinella palmiformis]|uniref:Uncharacterized protein n=1 Tax=Paralvinella palmiformis TaxID=53620 RepID=A0AAD9NIF6_9ANNE|nr:hypothetical protein LSH36_7g02024 [Paralvinella palmiformis]